MKDDFDAELRAHWGTPRPASPALKARLLSATAVKRPRRWLAISAAAAVLIGGISVGIMNREVPDDEIAWLVDNDDDAIDPANYFDLSTIDDVD